MTKATTKMRGSSSLKRRITNIMDRLKIMAALRDRTKTTTTCNIQVNLQEMEKSS